MTEIISIYFAAGIFLTLFMWITDNEHVFNMRDHFFMIIIWPYFLLSIIFLLVEDHIDGFLYKRSQKKRRKK